MDMSWITPELVREVKGLFTFGGAGMLCLLFWLIACKYKLPWRKKE